MERNYRKVSNPKGLVSFEVAIKQTDLWISAKRDLSHEARDLVLEARAHLEGYISQHPGFRSTLLPWREDPFAPLLVRHMVEASQKLGVGPMACVAGAIAEMVGEGLLKWSDEVVVENGGDIYANMKRSLIAGLFPQESKISGLGLKVDSNLMPVGICSSSATIGHSYSEGSADLVTVLAKSACYADGAATAICNIIKKPKDLGLLDEIANRFEGVVGVVAIMGETVACWGNVELTKI
ncbi:MAG: UPF0280 family protein [Deltaproteobacteria bacterium]|nr:MAG: UPF0280 family protein [Deltaproteobacteria bacterium]RLB86992.1 MAG: UPF0280 family protein [Deltaproteobacteria bacterium]